MAIPSSSLYGTIPDDEEEEKQPVEEEHPWWKPVGIVPRQDESPVASPVTSPTPKDTIGSPLPPASPVGGVTPAKSKYDEMAAAGSPVSHKHGFGGGLLKALDIAGTTLAPGLAVNIPGSTLNFRRGLNQEKQVEDEDLAQQLKQSQIGTQGAAAAAHNAQVPLANANTEHVKAETNALQNPQVKPKEEKWTVMKDVAGPNGEVLEEEENSGNVRIAPGSEGAKAKPAEGKGFEDQAYAEWAAKPENKGKSRMDFAKAYGAATQKPERPEKPQRQLGVTSDGKVIEITPGMTLQPGTKPLGGELNATLKSEQGEEAGKSAQQYAKDYVESKNYTGPGDEALMEKFFELAKPSSGFRMTHAQIEMLRTAQSWRNSIAASIRHATVGTWFSDTQRQQIVDTMGNLQKARDEVKPGSAASTTGEKGAAKDFGPAPSGKAEGSTGALPDGTKVVVRGGRVVAQ